MSKRLFSFIGILLVPCFFLQSALTVDDLVKKNIEAHGGYKKLKSLKSIKLTIKFSMQGTEGPATVIVKRPKNFRLDATFQGMTIIQAYNGKVGWSVMPFMGSTDPRKMSADELKEMEEGADIEGAFVDYKKKGHKIELIGKEDLEGTPAYKLKVTLKNGNVRYIFLDAEYFLEIKTNARMKRADNEFEVESILGDYKEVDGLMFAHSTEIKIGGHAVRQLTIEKVELNVDVDDSIFIMPEKKENKSKDK